MWRYTLEGQRLRLNNDQVLRNKKIERVLLGLVLMIGLTFLGQFIYMNIKPLLLLCTCHPLYWGDDCGDLCWECVLFYEGNSVVNVILGLSL